MRKLLALVLALCASPALAQHHIRIPTWPTNPVSCVASNIGGFYLDGTTYKPYVCDGTSWKEVIILAPTDDTVPLGSGTVWANAAIPNCTTGALQYTAATNTFSCGSAGVTGSGTANNLAKWVAPGTALGDSGITDTSTGVVPAAFTSTAVSLGGFDASAPGSSLVAGVGASGADTAGGALTIRTGPGTGTGAPGTFTLQVAPNSTTGSAQNTLKTLLAAGGQNFALGGTTINAGGSAPATSTVKGYIAAGTDIAGGGLTLAPGPSTGAGTSADITLQVAPNSGTGSSANALVAVFGANGRLFQLGGVSLISGGAGHLPSTITGYHAPTGSTNTTGSNLTIGPGRGTGSATPSFLTFNVYPNNSTGTTAATAKAALTFAGNGFTMGGTDANSGGQQPGTSTVRAFDAAGTDQAGGGLTVGTGQGTGSSTAPSLLLQVAPNQATGTGVNPLVTAATFNGTSVTVGNFTTVSGGTAPGASTFGGVNSAGSDVAGGNLVVQSGAGTGLAAGSTITFKTPAVGTTGTTPETQTTRMTMDTVGALMPAAQWLRQAAARSMLAANYTNATASMTNTALSITLLAGRKYVFRMSLFLADSVAGEGVLIDFDGGAATATNFRAHAILHDTTLLLSQQVSALATDIGVATVTGDSLMEVTGSIEVNAGGTFLVRASQNTHATGTLTIYRGSHIAFEDATGS